MLLPPPKATPSPEDDAAIVQYADGCVMEMAEGETQWTAQCEQARRNYNLYVGNHFSSPAPDGTARYVFNRIKTIVVSHAAIQLGTRPVIKFSGRESGEPGVAYFNTSADIPQTPEIAQILASIPPECMGAAGADPAPLPPPAVALLKRAIEEGKKLVAMAQMQQAPSPQVIPPEALIEINDNTAAAALQLVFDAKWEECNADYYVLQNVFNSGIVGWCHLVYQFDDRKMRHELFNAEYTQVFQDVTRTDISDSQHAIYDQIISAEQGMRLFPGIADKIREKSTEGRVAPAGAYIYRQAAVYEATTFRRSMLTLRTLFVRDQPYPMKESDAVAKGLVVAQVVDATELLPPAAQSGEAAPSVSTPGLMGKIVGGIRKFFHADGATHEIIPSEGEGEPTEGAITESPEQPAEVGGEAAAPATVPPPPAPIPTRTAYFLMKDGQQTGLEVKPWDPDWPIRYGIRQIRIIVGEVVDDRECEFVDIPLAQNVNFPLPNSPLGQGTPEDLEHLNIAFNNILTDLVVHHEYNAFSHQVIPESVANKLTKDVLSKYINPGSKPTVVPDALYEKFKGVIFGNNPPPPMPADAWKLLGQLLDLLDRQGEMAGVLNGQASPGWSGDAIERLQTAAQSSILFRSKRTEMMVKHLARLMEGAIIFRIPPEELAATIRKYPVYIWYAMRKWWHESLATDVAVQVTSGGGATKATETGQILNAAENPRIPLSPQSILEAMGKDPDVELQNTIEWQRKLGAAQNTMASAGAPAPTGVAPQGGPVPIEQSDGRSAAVAPSP